jgi:transcriptional regulator with XRE-family HTH domain
MDFVNKILFLIATAERKGVYIMGKEKLILFLIAKRGITKNKMLTDLHLSKNSINDWINRGTIPSGETLSKIAAYFNVSLDYLLETEQKNKPAVENDELNRLLKDPEMEEIYEILNRLSSDGVQKVLEYAHFQREQEKQQNL